MKKVLIISYLFTPSNSVGAIRATKLAKYLNKKGYQVDVVSADLNLNYTSYFKYEYKNVNNLWLINEENKKWAYKTININNYKEIKSETKYNKQTSSQVRANKHINVCKSKFILDLKNAYRSFLMLRKNKKFMHNFIRFINSSDFEGEKYDTVISSYGPLQSAFSGLEVKKKNKNIRWICDFRDPIIVEDTSIIFKPYYNYLQDKFCENADIITTVSNGYLKRINDGKYNEKIKMIPNGYDTDDLVCIYKEDKLFSFTYVGSLYEGKRDITIFFKVLHELINEKLINIQDVVFNYAGSDISILLLQAKKYNLEGIIVDYGKVSRQKSLKLQFSSRFLLLSTWNNKKEEGVFPGKFLEYMLANKPIIAIIKGGVSNSEVKDVMNKANLGVSYESINSKNDYMVLKNYIKDEYKRFVKGLSPNFNPNITVIEKYDWEKIISQFEELI